MDTNTAHRPNARPVALEDRYESWEIDGLPLDLNMLLPSAGTHSQAEAVLLQQLTDHLDELVSHYGGHGGTDRFLANAETWEDRLNRYATVRTLEIHTGLQVTPAPRPAWAAPDATLRSRHLRPLELGLVRLGAHQHESRRVAIVGVLEAGAASAELALVEADIVDGGSVDLPGCQRATPRTIKIPTFAEPAVSHLAGSVPSGPLLYSGNSDDPAKVQSSILMNVANLLRYVGLASDPTVKPLSIRNGGLRQIHDRDGFDACAAAAGAKNWQTLRTDIGLVAKKPVRVR